MDLFFKVEFSSRAVMQWINWSQFFQKKNCTISSKKKISLTKSSWTHLKLQILPKMVTLMENIIKIITKNIFSCFSFERKR
jgi:hypothetical protein